MLNKYRFLAVLLMAVFCFNTSAEAARSKVKGDPDLLWMTPLGKSDIKNNAYNRCLLIRAVKPGLGKGGKARRNAFDILSTYASNLYAQSIKISSQLEEENAPAGSFTAFKADANDEKALAEKITRTMADITRRLNIINSLEAGGVMVDSLMKIKQMDLVYDTFPAVVDGKWDYVSDCEALK